MTFLGPQSFRRQMIILVASVTALGMALLTLVSQLVLADIAKRDVTRVLADRADSVVQVVQVDPTSGELAVPPGRLDAGVVVYDANGKSSRARSPRIWKADIGICEAPRSSRRRRWTTAIEFALNHSR